MKVGASTGPLLAGTTLGLIIEAELTSDERFFSMGGVEEHFRFWMVMASLWYCYCRQVFDIGKGQHTPVTGLQYHSGSKSKYKHQCIAMVATIIIFKWWVRLLCSVWLKCKPNLNHIFEWWQCSAWHREVFREILQNTMEIFNDKYAVPGTGKYFVLATTPTRLYQFQGYVSSPSERPLLQQVF